MAEVTDNRPDDSTPVRPRSDRRGREHPAPAQSLPRWEFFAAFRRLHHHRHLLPIRQIHRLLQLDGFAMDYAF